MYPVAALLFGIYSACVSALSVDPYVCVLHGHSLELSVSAQHMEWYALAHQALLQCFLCF